VAVLPVFLKLGGRRVLLVGGGRVAAAKLRPLLDVGARVTVIAPVVSTEVASTGARIFTREFEPQDLDGVCYVVAAAPKNVNAVVAREATARGLFVNAVDDVENASAYAGAVLHRNGVTVAISTDGAAPALAGLLREAIDDLLPGDLDRWMTCAREERVRWLAAQVPMEWRRRLLLDALVRLYPGSAR
jgi:siroheme synthase-like protein